MVEWSLAALSVPALWMSLGAAPASAEPSCKPGDRSVCFYRGVCEADGASCACDDPLHYKSSDNCQNWWGDIVPPGMNCKPGTREYCSGNGTCTPDGMACSCDSWWWNGPTCATSADKCPGYGPQPDGSWSQVVCGGKQCVAPGQCEQDDPQPAGRYHGIAAGSAHWCAIRNSDNQVECGGNNESGQASPPKDVVFESLSAGGSYTCGVRAADGQVECWGSDSFGTVSNTPEGSFLQVSAGRIYPVCALDTDHHLVCWGDVSGWEQPSTTFSKISTGYWYGCGIRTSDGVTECWGPNDNQSQATPPANAKYVSLAASAWFACGLRADKTVECWGDPTFTNVPSGLRARSITAMNESTCAIKDATGHAICWGSSENATPPKPPAGVAFREISGGTWQACGIRELDGEVECWN